MQTISATEFKAKCLAILDDVERTGEPIVILKRGKPVARLMPPMISHAESPQASLRGTGRVIGDIVSPIIPLSDWEMEND